MNVSRDDTAALRALRRATFDYLVVLEAGLKALNDAVVEGQPEMAFLRSQLMSATGHRAKGQCHGSPIQIMETLGFLLGEGETP